jgi:uncharacterized membrane protein YkoI
MKTLIPAFTTLAFIACSAAAVASEERGSTIKDIPQPVLEAVHEVLQKVYPAATEFEYEEESVDGKIAYEVQFKDKGKKFELLYSADGALIETEEEIRLSKLPRSVVKAIKKEHPHAKLKEAEQILNPDGTLRAYEVEFSDGKKQFELEVDPSGVILKTVTEE